MGLSVFHCRYHVQFRNRHGSLWKGTYSRAQLSPYRRAAESFIRKNREDALMAMALGSLAHLLHYAGPVHLVHDTYQMKPPQKARAALARMRRQEVPVERLLAIYFAISAIISEDPVGPGSPASEFRIVQTAKAALRQASGYHSHYGPGNSYHRYPRSSGLFLRHLGQAIEDCCTFAAERHLPAVLALKQKRYGGWQS